MNTKPFLFIGGPLDGTVQHIEGEPPREIKALNKIRLTGASFVNKAQPTVIEGQCRPQDVTIYRPGTIDGAKKQFCVYLAEHIPGDEAVRRLIEVYNLAGGYDNHKNG